MRRTILVFILAAMFAGGYLLLRAVRRELRQFAAETVSHPPTALQAAPTCDLNEVWKQVYRPRRLQILRPCLEMTGTIVTVREQSDGDLHINLVPDPQFQGLLNDYNRGVIVVEPVCMTRIMTRHPAAILCRGIMPRFNLPLARGVRL